MRVVVQHVSHASCKVDGRVTGEIDHGLCLFVGFESQDNESILKQMAHKIVSLRIFPDAEGKMNLSVKDVNGKILSISQFTLYADCKKGNRPGFTQAAPAHEASMLYDRFNALLAEETEVETGIFQADMKIELLNDGPLTILLDSREVCK